MSLVYHIPHHFLIITHPDNIWKIKSEPLRIVEKPSILTSDSLVTHRLLGCLYMKKQMIATDLCQFYPSYASVTLCLMSYSNMLNELMNRWNKNDIILINKIRKIALLKSSTRYIIRFIPAFIYIAISNPYHHNACIVTVIEGYCSSSWGPGQLIQSRTYGDLNDNDMGWHISLINKIRHSVCACVFM